MNIKAVYQEMEDPRLYILRTGLPIVLMGFMVPFLFVYALPFEVVGIIRYVLFMIPVYSIIVAVLYPVIEAEGEKNEVEDLLPLFVARMAILSTSGRGIKDIFRLLGDLPEFGRLSRDAKRVYKLINVFHLDSAEACGYAAERTPSDVEADFLNRLGHSISVGVDLQSFLENEQDVVMDEAETLYEIAMNEIDTMKEVFMATATAMIFFWAFVAFIPILTPIPMEPYLIMTVAFFVGIEGVFVFVIRAKLPKDEIWFKEMKKKYRIYPKITKLLAMVIPLTAITSVIMALVLYQYAFPIAIFFSLITTPWIVPGLLIHNEEKKVIRRDQNFGAFIRSLGRSMETKGESMVGALKTLRFHNYGPLTDSVVNLYKRAATQISKMDAWRHFCAETGSNLIQKLSEMFVHGTMLGAPSRSSSVFVSKYMERILSLREKRYAMAANYTGIMYGFAVAIAFALYTVYYILVHLKAMFAELDFGEAGLVTDGGALSSLFNASFDVTYLPYAITGMLIIHASASSVVLTLIRGGHKASAILHFVGMIWVATVVYVITEYAIGRLL